MKSSLSCRYFLQLVCLILIPAAVSAFAQKEQQTKAIDLDEALAEPVLPDRAASYYHYALAKWDDEQGDLPKALSEMQIALRYNEDSSVIHFELAVLLEKSGNTLEAIEHALEADKLQRENQGLRRLSYTSSEPLGKSATMQRLREQVKRVAQHDSWVLMYAEPGCGINVVAHYLHSHSAQRERPFIDVNVASLTAETSARDLFGAEDGDKVHYGLLEQANGGTLLLHDIAEMDATTQAKLFSALDTGTFQRIGADEPVALDVRIIAATHQNLESLVDQGRFRKDLYFQLNVVPIQIPPLRNHREDIPELITYFTRLYVDQEDLPYRKFSTAAQNRLRNYDWPGNVRELMNLIQRLLIVGSGSEVSIEEVEVALGTSVPVFASSQGMAVIYDLPLRQAREQFERDYLEYQLRLAGGSVGKVAKAAGLERTHLYRKLRSLGIDPKNISSDS